MPRRSVSTSNTDATSTLAATGRRLGRRYLLIDESPEAYRVMCARLGAQNARSASPSGVEGAASA